MPLFNGEKKRQEHTHSPRSAVLGATLDVLQQAQQIDTVFIDQVLHPCTPCMVYPHTCVCITDGHAAAVMYARRGTDTRSHVHAYSWALAIRIPQDGQTTA